jgi:hypothetical protein
MMTPMTAELAEYYTRWAVFQRTLERPEAEITQDTWLREVDPVRRLYCLDCGAGVIGCTVHDHVWALTDLGYADGVLCLPCLAQRIGRPLCLDDFRWDLGINREAEAEIRQAVDELTKKRPSVCINRT